MKIIGIETSSPLFSIAMAENDRIVFEIRKDRRIFGPTRDAGIFDDVREMLRSIDHKQIQALAISIGPGLFTSLRVGLSLAKGLAVAWNKPVIAVNSLDLLGAASLIVQAPLLALIDAYHNELYAARYQAGHRIGNYELATPQALIKSLRGKWAALGSGIKLMKEYRHNGAEIDFIENDSFMPNATGVIKLARPRFDKQQFENIDDLEPFYLKRTDAERNRNKTDEIR